MKNYNTQRDIATAEGKAYVAARCFNATGAQEGCTTSGFMEPKQVAEFITALCNLLHDAPDNWPASRMVITVR